MTEEETVTSHDDGTTHFSDGTNVVTVLNDMENKVPNVFEADPDKSNLLLTSTEEISIKLKVAS